MTRATSPRAIERFRRLRQFAARPGREMRNDWQREALAAAVVIERAKRVGVRARVRDGRSRSDDGQIVADDVRDRQRDRACRGPRREPPALDRRTGACARNSATRSTRRCSGAASVVRRLVGERHPVDRNRHQRRRAAGQQHQQCRRPRWPRERVAARNGRPIRWQASAPDGCRRGPETAASSRFGRDDETVANLRAQSPRGGSAPLPRAALPTARQVQLLSRADLKVPAHLGAVERTLDEHAGIDGTNTSLND